MIQTLDPHSSYLTPEMLKQVEVETKGVFGGWGSRSDEGRPPHGDRPIEDTPAARAGLLAGDKIVKMRTSRPRT